jgi:CheY-like chemotaxis protein
MGYRADVVSNGLEVLEALRRQSYDVVLMDVQMPEMDGLTATQRICQEWSRTERPWIVAMTANAMQGDKEMCLEAGMDDYVSKPIRVEELSRALSKCQQELRVSRLKVESSEDNLQPANLQPSNLPTFDHRAEVLDATAFRALREMVNKDEVLVKVIDSYLEEAPKQLQAMRKAVTPPSTVAVAQKEVSALEWAAHSLKSTSATLGATRLSELCQELEAIAPTSSLVETAAIVSQLETEYERVKTALVQKRQHLNST